MQGTPRQSDDTQPEQAHAFDYDTRDAHDPASLIDCLYLYREFSSEALRILVPYTTHGVDEAVVQSFVAALQLGLKQRFGGQVDHLRIGTQEEPGRDGGPRRAYVLLYDSVPGGTGYLHQLLAQDATTLIDVFKQALEAITRCPCNLDAEKDGCYRCVYQYRQGRAMEQVSRDRDREVLTELVGATDQLERVPTIADIFINPHFDSALEARFMEALRQLSGCAGLPTVKLVQDIVNGKSGYLLEVASQRYWIEPQVELTHMDGISVACKPDFVIWPGKVSSSRRPIAVFCDGWMYHGDSLREDAQKRSILVASGRFWVWSVTSDDVKAALDGNLVTDLESPLTSMNYHAVEMAPPSLPRAESQAWASVLNGVLPEVTAGMQRLMEADVPPPDEVGYEHANERGEVDAEAEAAWLAAQVVVLTEAQMECASIWQVQGWTTVPAQEGWEVAVQEKLDTAGAHR